MSHPLDPGLSRFAAVPLHVRRERVATRHTSRFRRRHRQRPVIGLHRAASTPRIAVASPFDGGGRIGAWRVAEGCDRDVNRASTRQWSHGGLNSGGDLGCRRPPDGAHLHVDGAITYAQAYQPASRQVGRHLPR
jgi:hypothetical protein